jgi:hypothetical protein
MLFVLDKKTKLQADTCPAELEAFAWMAVSSLIFNHEMPLSALFTAWSDLETFASACPAVLLHSRSHQSHDKHGLLL